jgi:hypothetical protein
MRKILIIITSIALFLGICSYFLFFGEKPIWNITYKVAPTVSDNLYTDMRSTVEKENEKNIDLYNTAIRDQDPLLCDGIGDNDKKVECHDMITATIAQKTWLIETCDTLTGTWIIMLCRDTINNDRAITTQNKILCDGISDSDRKLFCQEGVDEIILQKHIETHTVTKEICSVMSSRYQKTCMIEIREIDESELYKNAISKDDLELCDKITSIELKSTCLDTINLKTAITTQNSILCENLKNEEKKLYCIGQVSKTNDIALYKSAISSNDLESCSRIINENLRNKCHDTIIITTVKSEKDITLCDTLTNTGMIISCKQLGQ